MRSLLMLSLVATSALAAPRKPIVAIFPPTGADETLRQLALLIEARASELAEQTGKVNQLHLKQVLRAIDEERLAPDADLTALLTSVGADRAVSFSLSAERDALLLRGERSDGKTRSPFSAKLDARWNLALQQGSEAVARALLGAVPLPKKSGAVQPASGSEAALRALGRCYEVVLRQPLAVDTPTLVDHEQLKGAVESCGQALELDPSLRFAHAAHALGQAILGDDTSAVKSLAALGDGDDVVELYTLARFWLLTRYQSNEAGLAYLKQVLKRHPGELIARAFLGETQFALGDWPGAEQTWRSYVALAPTSAWAQGRLSKALARQARHDDAIAAARTALQLVPTSADARLELGSRYIDAARLEEAQQTLEPLVRLERPRAEHFLRLGWAHWLEGEVDDAERFFRRAVELSVLPAEWRTKGRATYDLALVQMKRGDRAAAKRLLADALGTGWRTRELDPSLKEVAKELERGELARAAPAEAPPEKAKPRETSVLPLNLFGEVDPYPKRPPPPEGLILFRF